MGGVNLLTIFLLRVVLNVDIGRLVFRVEPKQTLVRAYKKEVTIMDQSKSPVDTVVSGSVGVPDKGQTFTYAGGGIIAKVEASVEDVMFGRISVHSNQLSPQSRAVMLNRCLHQIKNPEIGLGMSPIERVLNGEGFDQIKTEPTYGEGVTEKDLVIVVLKPTETFRLIPPTVDGIVSQHNLFLRREGKLLLVEMSYPSACSPRQENDYQEPIPTHINVSVLTDEQMIQLCAGDHWLRIYDELLVMLDRQYASKMRSAYVTLSTHAVLHAWRRGIADGWAIPR